MNKVISLIGIVSIAAMLSACATTGPTTIVTQQVFVPISPPTTLFNCPQVNKLPNPDTLTNEDVANLIVQLRKDNKICGANMKGIQNYIDKAISKINNTNVK